MIACFVLLVSASMAVHPVRAPWVLSYFGLAFAFSRLSSDDNVGVASALCQDPFEGEA